MDNFPNVFNFELRHHAATQRKFVQCFCPPDNGITESLRRLWIVAADECDQPLKIGNGRLREDYFEAHLGIIFLTSSSDATSP